MTAFFQAEPPQAESAVGIVLLNLGTPAAPTAAAVRPYLREFLSDRRVVELPRWLWQPLLRGIILPFRGRKSAHAYRKIWLPEGSPLLHHTARLTEALAQALPRQTHTRIICTYAMTYGQPSVANVLSDLKCQGVDRILVVPLFPQYAASCNAAALDKVWQVLQKQRNQMAVCSIKNYYRDAGYIRALAQSIRRHWQEHGRGDKLLLSFHGIPQAQHDQGDPYPEECRTTSALLAEALELAENDYIVAFQSRFGRARWVGPSTQDLLLSLPREGVTKLDIVCPGFACDCLETLEEIALRGRGDFLAAGGETLNYIPCLNDDEEWVAALRDLVMRHLGAWLTETA